MTIKYDFGLSLENDVCSFLKKCHLHSQACYGLNTWIEYVISNFKTNKRFENETIQGCSRLLCDGLKKTNSTFSSLLFWISFFYLTSMIFCAYFVLTFLFKLFNGSLTLSDLAKIAEFSIATIAMILTLFYINFLSHDVYTNLQELKNCIAEIDSGLTGNY